ncbi:MAG: hypothetical protein ABI039_11625 [Vicinamibacterales bacterium]
MRPRFTAALVLLLAACATPEAPAPNRALATIAPVSRDSAGIALHEHAADALTRAPLFTMSERPVTEVDGKALEVNLAQVRQLLMLADGRIAFFAEGTLFIVDAKGAIIERIGRTGSGPDEFQFADLSRGLGDTLILNDSPARRISFVVPGNGVVRSRRYRSLDMFGVVGQFANDALLLGTDGLAQPMGTESRVVIPWHSGRLDAGQDSAVVVDTVGGHTLVKQDGGWKMLRYAGSPWVAAWRGNFLTFDGSKWELAIHQADGALGSIVRIPVARRAIDAAGLEADRAGEIANARQRLAGASGPEAARIDTVKLWQSIRNGPIADSLPVITRALVGPDGTAWIKDGGYRFGEAGWGWTAIRPDGAIIGRLVGQGVDPVVAFGTDAVVLKSEDSDGFVSFHVHRLTQGSTPGD